MNNDAKIALYAAGGVFAASALTLLFSSTAKNLLIAPEQIHFINELHPVARSRFSQFISEVQKKTGYTVAITDAYRPFADSVRLKKENSKNATPGLSFHNYGMSIDINLVKGTEVIRKASPRSAWLKSGVVDIAKRLNLRWGGDFADYYDPVHFDMGKEYSTTVLLSMAKKQFGPDPEKIQGNRLKLS